MKSGRQRLLYANAIVIVFIGATLLFRMSQRGSNWDFRMQNHGNTCSKIDELVDKEEFTEEDIAFIKKGMIQDTDEYNKSRIFWRVLISYKGGGGGPDHSRIRQRQCKEILVEYLNDEDCTDIPFKGWALRNLEGYEMDEESIELYKRYVRDYSAPELRLSAAKVLYHLGEKESVYQVYEQAIAEGVPVTTSFIDFRNDTAARETLIRTLKYSDNPVGQATSMCYLALLGEKELIVPVFLELKRKLKDGEIVENPDPPDNPDNANAINYCLDWTEQEWAKRR